MPIHRTGNMWNEINKYDLFCITTNGTIRKDGCLVMGRGIAFEAISRFPDVQRLAGAEILEFNACRAKRGDPPRPYGFLVLRNYEPSVGLFQVKYNWWEQADVKLISLATLKLSRLAVDFPGMKIALNFPGIGNGKLSEDVVRPIIDSLPENVEVWKRG